MEDNELSVQNQNDGQNKNAFEETGTGERKLVRSSNKMFLGVCSGIAEFFRIDATIIRLIAVFFALAGIGSGIVVYLIAAIIIPKAPDHN